MLRSDFLVHSEVRRELARTQADIEKIHFGVTRGVIYLGGEFSIQMGVRNFEGQRYFDILVSTLVGLEKRLRRIPEVVDILFTFNNVGKHGGFWHHVQTRSAHIAPILTKDVETIEGIGLPT